MTLSHPLFLFALMAVSLMACGEVREDLGMGRNPPDEFAVMERPPLSMPPDFGLRPPRPGVPRPQSVDTTSQARESVFNGNNLASNAPSEGEKALLSATGATKTDNTIRETVDREASQKVVASPHLVERLMDWTTSSDNPKPATTVDAEAEAERIKKAQADNQPVSQGATPVIEKQTSGWLGL